MLPVLLQIGSFSGPGSAETTLLPLVVVAMLIDSAIVSIWYALGVILNNSQVKNSAITEFYQLGGTALLAVIIIGLLVTFSTSFYSIMTSTQLLSPTAISTLCQSIITNNGGGLSILGSNGGVLSGPASANPTTFTGLCNMVDPKNLNVVPPPITAWMDYPLAVTGVVIANITSQTATNLNSAFVYDAYIGFLSKFSPTVGICIAFTPPAVTCLPFFPFGNAEPSVQISVAFTPDAGYNFLYISLTPFGTVMTNAFTVLVGELVVDMVLIVAWPYLIFAGLILRSTPFTRGVGGFLIAVGIGVVLFYPLTFAMEYLALGGGTGTTAIITENTIYGYNAVTTIPGNTLLCPGNYGTTPQCYCAGCTAACDPSNFNPICVNPDGSKNNLAPSCMPEGFIGPPSSYPSCNYTVNFFVQPDLKGVINHYNCWPHVPLFVAELGDIGAMMVPFWSVYGTVVSLISNGQQPNYVPDMDLPYECRQSDAYSTFSALLQSFGLIGMTTYLLPIINLIITISAVLGVSGMLGGDTSLAGLSKFL
jgi:hypothetical protein